MIVKMDSKGRKEVILVDPPEGWKYGFPAPIQEDYKQQLIDAGYPEDNMDLAISHSRFIHTGVYEDV